MAGPGAGHRAAQPPGGAHPRAQPDDLSPLDAEAVPLEVAPFGGLGERPADAAERLHRHAKRFPADAAHQLKTLAGLRMQADLAQREGASAEDLKQSLRQIGRSSIRATTP